jgi:hypothetical protein
MIVKGRARAMKLFVGLAVFVWLLCGLAGTWMLEGSGDLQWKMIARGPLTLVKAFNDKPVSYPGP